MCEGGPMAEFACSCEILGTFRHLGGKLLELCKLLKYEGMLFLVLCNNSAQLLFGKFIYMSNTFKAEVPVGHEKHPSTVP